MDWQRVGKKMLGFVLGAGGVAVAVFVVLPWFEASDKAKNGPRSRDAIVEEVLASFGGPENEDTSENVGMTDHASGLMPIPSLMAPVRAESPVPVLPTIPAEVAARPLQGEAVLSFVPAEAPLPEDAAVVVSASQAVPAEIGKHADTEIEAVTEEPPAEDAQAVEESVPGEPASGVVIEARAEKVPTAEYVFEEELAPDMQPNSEKLFQRWIASSDSSGAGLRRLEFEMPAGIRTVKTPLRASDKADGSRQVLPPNEFSPRGVARPDAPAAAGNPARSTDRVRVPDTLRGVMGYRLPLVSRQELPDQVVSGVLIPAHTSYVILRPGYWEMVGLSPGDVEALRAAVEKAKAEQQSVRAQPPHKGWDLLRLFRRKQTPTRGN